MKRLLGILLIVVTAACGGTPPAVQAPGRLRFAVIP
jgi:hypothetical protein